MPLPIESVVPDIQQILQRHNSLIIQAPPGAGKTTVVPLALLESVRKDARILLIQPRRLAVYGAAHRMAQMLNEPIGKTIGYTTRYDSKKSSSTRIEVITEGIFLRKIQQDAELADTHVVIFDEFHERSVTIDLSLAFAIETQQGFRDTDTPLKLLVMSATLDGDKLSAWLQAPLIKSEGRTFPVDVHYRPPKQHQPLEAHIAQLIRQICANPQGSLLVFLPGMKEIKRVKSHLEHDELPENIKIHELHASLPQEQQQQAIAPCPDGNHKIVLTTNVAETSVTIEGISTVIDSGLVRVSRFDERRGMNVLETEKISAASAEQRKGRAGRLSKGSCYRTWSESEQRQLKPFSEAEILSTDLLPVALELAIWGCQDTQDLMLLTPPPSKALERAKALLVDMDALNESGAMTPLGRKLANMGIHPRLAQLIVLSESSAAIAAAAILSEGDPLRFHQQWPQSDFMLRLALWDSTKSIGQLHKGTWDRIKKLAQQLSRRNKQSWRPEQLGDPDIAIGLARSFPDHVAQLRKNSELRYVLANGKGAQLNPEDNLANTPYLVILDASGNDKEPFIRLACALTEAQLKQALSNHFTTTVDVDWNEQKSAVEAQEVTRLGKIVIASTKKDDIHQDAIEACLLDAIKQKGLDSLPWRDETEQLVQRVLWLKQRFPDHWPDWHSDILAETIDEWLKPFLAGFSTLAQIQSLNLTEVLISQLTWEQINQIDQQAPASWKLPTGQQRKITYQPGKEPVLSARMQELYGTNKHPCLPNGAPLVVEILSPAKRPIQLTSDLPNFWQGSYQEVAKEMRGRYPKHYWPEDPGNAQATTKTKKHM